MAKKALVIKAAAKPKFKVRGYTRCQKCGRPRAVLRKFGLCRICVREMAHAASCPASARAAGKPRHFDRRRPRSVREPRRGKQ